MCEVEFWEVFKNEQRCEDFYSGVLLPLVDCRIANLESFVFLAFGTELLTCSAYPPGLRRASHKTPIFTHAHRYKIPRDTRMVQQMLLQRYPTLFAIN